jgi:signal transduction histidine kinase
LGLIAVKSIESSFYSDADKELRESGERLISVNNPGRPDSRITLPTARNSRINYLIYYENGELLGHDLPDFMSAEGLPAPDGAERIYNRKIGDFNFRTFEFSFEYKQTTFYAQIILNIDGEIALRNNIVTVYLICLGVIIVLTVFASYIMSGITMSPIIKSMEKQSEFVSDASHELRTPLTVLHSRLEQLLSCPNDRIIDKSEEISDCLSEVIRLSKLSNNLLTLAKSDADKILPELTEFDLYDLINKVAVPYIETAACGEKTFTVKGEPLLVNADAEQLMQVIVILFDNALKYTLPGDNILVSLKKVKNKCELTVADTGIGISENGLKHIFERFYRDDASRGIIEGNGLGLSIARQILQEHNGTIRLEPNSPKGTKAVITI